MNEHIVLWWLVGIYVTLLINLESSRPTTHSSSASWLPTIPSLASIAVVLRIAMRNELPLAWGWQ
jgi:hypothetical protein